MTTNRRENYAERMKALTDKLESGIKDLFESQKFKDYLKMMGCFHGYSFNNVLLIQMQKPDASMVAGYKTWQTLERQVKKGETGITILVPCPHRKTMEVEVLDPKTKEVRKDSDGNVIMETKEVNYTSFKTATIFDVSQTEGKTLPTLTEELKGTVEDYPILFDFIRKIAPVPIRFESWNESKKGYYSLASKEIVIKEGMSELQTLKTVIHETAHSILHKDKAHLKDSATMEVEAESIAYVICQNFGIDTSDYSFGYIAGWSVSKELPELQSSLTTIQKTSHSLIAQIESEVQKHIQKQAISLDGPEQAIGLSYTTEVHRHRR